MGPSQICGCPFREPRVFEIAHIGIANSEQCNKWWDAVGYTRDAANNMGIQCDRIGIEYELWLVS